jgi:hypothetical protein
MRIPVIPRCVRAVKHNAKRHVHVRRRPVTSSSDPMSRLYLAAEARCSKSLLYDLEGALAHVSNRRGSRQVTTAPLLERIHQLLALMRGLEGVNGALKFLLLDSSFVTANALFDSSPTLVKALALASSVTNVLAGPSVLRSSPGSHIKDLQMVLLRTGKHASCVASHSMDSPTFSVASSLVALGRGDDAARAAAFIISQRKQWRSFDSNDISLLHEISRHLGQRGSPQQLSRFLKSCSHFYTPSLIMGRVVEVLISGVSDRAFRVVATAMRGVLSTKLSLSSASNMLQIGLSFVGSDLNKDALFSLIDTIARIESPVTVSLIASIIRAIECSECLAITCGGNEQMLFRRYAYKSLCETSPDLGLHFLSSWEATQRELTSTPLAAEHWCCLSCGKANSKRYSFCSCSAIQHGLITCEHCNFAQDERNSNCLICSRSLSGDIRTPRALKNWRCNSCRAPNHAFQLYQCGKCGAPSELCSSLHLCTPKGAQGVPSCGCSPIESSSRPISQQPFCTGCGHREAWFSNHASHFTWFCGTCEAYHSWSDAVCPVFGNTERAQHTPCRRWEDTVVCPSCRFAHSSPFVVSCHNCSEDIRSVGTHDHDSIGSSPGSRHGVALACSRCSHVNLNARASDQCENCSAPLGDAEVTATRKASCPSCGYSTSQGLGVFCERCGELALSLDDDRHSDFFNRCGWMNVLPSLRTLSVGPKTYSQLISSAVLEKLVLLCRSLDACPSLLVPQLEAPLKSVQAQHSERHQIASRRVSSLCRQLLDLISPKSTIPEARSQGCAECGGSHPTSTCAFAKKPWVCQTCEAPQWNDGLSRYWCPACHEMRPEIAVLLPDEAWTCFECGKLNLDLERFCVDCGCNRDNELTGAAARIPLIPSECSACRITYLEAVCPKCGEDALRTGPDELPPSEEGESVEFSADGQRGAQNQHQQVKSISLLPRRDTRVPRSLTTVKASDFSTGVLE